MPAQGWCPHCSHLLTTLIQEGVSYIAGRGKGSRCCQNPDDLNMFIIIALYPTSSCSHLLLRLVFDSLVKIPKYCDGQTVYGGENTGECRWCKAVSLPHPNTHQIPIGMCFAHLKLAQNCKQLIFLLQMLH